MNALYGNPTIDENDDEEIDLMKRNRMMIHPLVLLLKLTQLIII